MNRKLAEISNNEINKVDKLEFRHEKYREIEEKLGPMVEAGEFSQEFKHLWKDFLNYIKSRDKKIKELESLVRKKEREVSQKEKFEEMIKEELIQTQNIYQSNQAKIEAFESFINKVDKEMTKLVEENFTLKTAYDQERTNYDTKVKAEHEIRLKMEEKLKSYHKVDEIIEEFKRHEQELVKKYNEFVNERSQVIERLQIEANEKSVQITNVK